MLNGVLQAAGLRTHHQHQGDKASAQNAPLGPLVVPDGDHAVLAAPQEALALRITKSPPLS